MNITRDHIIQYLHGELPHHEQYELEKKMLEDPFLSDAIEGLQELDDPEKINEVLGELESFIESNYGKVSRVIPIYRNPIAIAAAISLIVLSVAVVFLVPDYREKIQSLLITDSETAQTDTPIRSRQTEPEEPKSMDKEEIDDAEITISDEIIDDQDAAPVALNEVSEATGAGAREEYRQDTLLAADEESFDDPVLLAESPVSEDTTTYILEETDIEGIAGQPMQQPEQELVSEIEAAEPNQVAKRALATETAEISLEVSNLVFGIVTSANDNRPIPGVNVLVTGTSRGTITDGTGSYDLELSDSENGLEFNFIGYESSQLDVSGRGSYDVMLQTDATQLSEVVVVGYGQGEDRTVGADRYASPVTSRTAYNRYLRDNLEYPQAAAENNISGPVIVEITIASDGSISGMEVTGSLGFGCDEEALRLIRQGPAWNPAIRNGINTEERVRVAVRFRP